MEGIALIAAERERQLDDLGWTPDHDRVEHQGQELVYAAAAYLLNGSGWVAGEGMTVRSVPNIWPWEDSSWKPSPTDRVRELVKAGALIVAEIDRLTTEAAGEQRP